jgi:hypothetical protein
MLALTFEPPDVDAALPAYAPPFAFPANALHSHAPCGLSREGLSRQTACVGTASGGSRLSLLFVFLAPLALLVIHNFCCKYM